MLPRLLLRRHAHRLNKAAAVVVAVSVRLWRHVRSTFLRFPEATVARRDPLSESLNDCRLNNRRESALKFA